MKTSLTRLAGLMVMTFFIGVSIVKSTIIVWPVKQKPSLRMQDVIQLAEDHHEKATGTVAYTLDAGVSAIPESAPFKESWALKLGDENGTVWAYSVTSDRKVQLVESWSEAERSPDLPSSLEEAIKRLQDGLQHLGFNPLRMRIDGSSILTDGETEYYTHKRDNQGFDRNLTRISGPGPNGIVIEVREVEMSPEQDFSEYGERQPYWEEYKVNCSFKTGNGRGLHILIKTGLDIKRHVKYQIEGFARGT